MSSFGHLYQVTTFGESHCAGVGCIVQGVPPRMRLDASDIQIQLDRRRPGQSKITTQRKETDTAIILSGIEHGYTLGTPISILVRNQDQRPHDYSLGGMLDIPRPSHADYTYQAKYGIRASSGGGRASARETIGRVAAGAIAEKWLREKYGVDIVAWVSQVGHVELSREWEEKQVTRDMVDSTLVRCPDSETSAKMQSEIESALADRDSLGGVITCVIRNTPAGLGEPVFDKLEALLAHAMLSIPSTKGFEVGSGFAGTRMRGSQHNDKFVAAKGNLHNPTSSPEQKTAENASTESSSSSSSSSSSASFPCPTNPASSSDANAANLSRLVTTSNRSGGIQGGISNGADIVFRVAFKPPATIGVAQETADFNGDIATLKAEGRHDPCVLPRAIPIVETMAALVLADQVLIQLSREQAALQYPIQGKVQPAAKPEGAKGGGWGQN